MYKTDTLYHLWRTILGLDKPIEETWPMKKGHILEDYVARLFEEEIGYKICKVVQGAKNSSDWLAVNRKSQFLRVSPDRLFWTSGSRKLTERGVLEIKSSSKVFNPEDLSDPSKCLMWYCQVQYNLHVLKLPFGYLGYIHDDGVVGGDHWFQKIEYNKAFCERTLIPAITEFWKLNVEPARNILDNYKVEDATQTPADILSLIHEYSPAITDAEDVAVRYPSQAEGKSVSGDDFAAAIVRYKELKESAVTIKAQLEEIENKLKVAMLDAESMTIDGRTVCTYKSNKDTRKLNTKLFETEEPETYAKYLITTPGARVLKVK